MSDCTIANPCAFPGDDDTGTGRVVRFDSECELITLEAAQKQRPVLTTKSYSLPLWKKPSALLPSGTSKNHTSGQALAPTPSLRGVEGGSSKDQGKDKHVILKLSIPRFKSQSKLTPTRTIPGPNELKPLSPCLVHRTPGATQNCAPRLGERRPSLPTHLLQALPGKRSTVPLRPCCKACFSAIEQSTLLGDSWEIKLPSHRTEHGQRRTASDGESRRVKDFSDVTVDEVEALLMTRESFSESRGIGLTIDAARANSAGSPLSLSPTSPLPSPVVKTPVDDDDDQLFPLPSCPKIRTPSPRASPNPSPSPSCELAKPCLTNSLAINTSPADLLTHSAPLRRAGKNAAVVS